MNVPALTIWSQSTWFSASEPSHQWTAAGWHRLAISCTQAMSFWLVVPGVFERDFVINCFSNVLKTDNS